MRARWMGLVLAVGGVLMAPHAVWAASVPHLVNQQIQSLNTTGLEQSVNQMIHQSGGPALPSVGQIAHAVLEKKVPFDPQTLLAALGTALLGDLGVEGRVLGIIFLLTVLAALLARLGETFETNDKQGLVALTQMVVVSALILVALHSFGVAITMVRSLVGNLVHFMESLIPLLMVLIAGSGAVASAGIFHPLMLLVTNVVAVLTKQWVLPLVLMATLVELISVWLPRFSLKNLAGLFRTVGLTLLGGLMTLFLGVMAVEGAAGSVADGVTLRTGKFLANTFVPVIGKMFSDAMEAVLGSSMLLKNAVSVFGALGIIALVAFPLVKLFAMMALYRVGAAASEPLGVPGVGAALNLMANALGWLMAIAGAVALMFFLVVTVVVSTTNGVQL
ncbi:stage III sporulation protein AE [Sulfobacillus harzensis]|uniref:Stage III sporulation protein AE n=1 Tax=Sulfobacillus harzensis TaxID=2729629 RepID=A0A7Y0L0R0_9FIRM|nr:stage III sporulation protein AE [Sulfobacillus harzensis]NMP21158.1 stage III sporulation protein AE [Sulfobacillus harzensis]